MNYIYKIINTVNGKIYIGQTRKTIQHRWAEHICAAQGNPDAQDYNYLLHKAIRKYGVKSFQIEEVERVQEEKDLSSREEYWINYYNSCILEEESNGYNMTYGGEGRSKINKQEIFALWDNEFGSNEISKKTGYSAFSVRKLLETYSNYNKEIDFARNNGVPVYCYNNQGKLIAKYPSIAYAAKTVGVDASVINKCCNGIKVSAAGYFWSYTNDAVFENKELKRWKKLAISQLTLSGEIIAEYESLSAAGRAMNKKQTKYIKECCEGKRKQMYGFLWKYTNEIVDTMAQNASMAAKEDVMSL